MPANPRNSGFTLIELLIVIAVIGLLIGLLVPAVMAVMRRARDAEVRTEISQLDAAITAFKAEYGGDAPPSRITLYEKGSAADPADAADTSWEKDTTGSKAIIRRIWPQFDFTLDRELNGTDPMDATSTLNGAECLVLFLGGVRNSSGQLVGFSKNPADPFAIGGNRVGPFYDFDSGRLTETGGDANAPEYLDPLSSQNTPYVYLSSYDGRGYRLADIPSGTLARWYVLPDDTPDDLTNNQPYKPNSYQIISPGADGAYGTGGVYDGQNFTAPSTADEDNITNFGKGRLAP